MTVAPFIVETGMVRASKIRFPGMLNIVEGVLTSSWTFIYKDTFGSPDNHVLIIYRSVEYCDRAWSGRYHHQWNANAGSCCFYSRNLLLHPFNLSPSTNARPNVDHRFYRYWNWYPLWQFWLNKYKLNKKSWETWQIFLYAKRFVKTYLFYWIWNKFSRVVKKSK